MCPSFRAIASCVCVCVCACVDTVETLHLSLSLPSSVGTCVLLDDIGYRVFVTPCPTVGLLYTVTHNYTMRSKETDCIQFYRGP